MDIHNFTECENNINKNISREFKNIIPVVFATNENYAPYAAVTITSIIKNSSRNYFYDIYVFHTSLSNETIKKFGDMSSKNASVTCLDVNSYIDSEIPLYENFHFSKEMYYRILIPTILPQYGKVIYLDSDMVILGDLSELFNTDIGDCVLAGVRDVMHSVSRDYVENVICLDPDRYINSGMLVINCRRFKELKIKEKCFEELMVSDTKFRYPDQDIINIVCGGNIKLLGREWNYIWHYYFPRFNQSKKYLLPDNEMKEYLDSAENIKILHYTSNIKPWNNYHTRFTKIFFDYVEATLPFKSEIYNRYNSLPMKNYIVCQFMDLIGDDIILTCNLSTLEDYLFSDKIYMSINGKSSRINMSDKRYLDINGLCYAQRFFKIKLSYKEIENGLEITFFRDGIKDDRLIVVSGKFFPSESSIQIPAYFDKYYINIKERKILFGKIGRKGKIKNELRTLKNLLKVEKKSGKKSFILRIFYFLTKPFFRKKIWLISDRTSSAGDNGEAFFRYLSNTKPKGIKPYFVIEKISPDYKRLKKTGKVVPLGSAKFYMLYLHCSANISSQFEEKIAFPFYDIYLKDLMIKRKNVFLQHGIIKDDLSLAYNRFNQNMDLFITSSKAEYDSIISTKDYFMNAYNVALTGLARYDFFNNSPEKTIYILPTWRKSITLDLGKEEDVYNSEFYRFYTSLLQNEKLLCAVQDKGYKLKFVPHELVRMYFEDIKTDDNVEIITKNVVYKDIFAKGALLVTDYSSTAFDFAYLKKPVIYCQFDAEKIYAEHTYKKGYFDYERDGMGEVVYNETDLVDKIIDYINNGCKMLPVYKERVENFFLYTDKNNCQRIFEAIINYGK